MTPLVAVAAGPETWKVILNKFQALLKLIWARISGKCFLKPVIRLCTNEESWEAVVLAKGVDFVNRNRFGHLQPPRRWHANDVCWFSRMSHHPSWLADATKTVSTKDPKLLKQVKFTCSHQSAAYVYKINKCPVQNLVSPVFFHPTAIWSSSGPIVV